MDVQSIQRHLVRLEIDGWLLYDFQGQNPIGRRIAGVEGRMLTRRWFCFVPREGEPRWLVSRVEESQFSGLPGAVSTFRSWATMVSGLRGLIEGCARVAMEYAPEGRVPYVSRVDAGTVELVRSLGVEVVSSADLVQWCEVRWSAGALATHLEAARHLAAARERAFQFIHDAVAAGRQISEYDVQQDIGQYFELQGLVTNSPPIVAAGRHTSDPHYQPVRERSALVEEGDLVLVDLWAKMKEPGAVYADITWMAFVGEQVPDEFARIFAVVLRARNAATEFVQQAVAQGKTVRGYQVDDVARGVISAAGYGEAFIHRTGHNIGTEDHGAGLNFDNLETHDDRAVIPDIACSIEPGIYLDLFGMRSEVNIYVGERRAEVTTVPIQRGIVPLMRDR